MRECLQTKYTGGAACRAWEGGATRKKNVSLSFYASFGSFSRLFTQGSTFQRPGLSSTVPSSGTTGQYYAGVKSIGLYYRSLVFRLACPEVAAEGKKVPVFIVLSL